MTRKRLEMPGSDPFSDSTTEVNLNLEDFNYNLPEHRIAQFPLDRRDKSKLLVYKKGRISHHIFSDLPAQIDNKSLFVFNETRVIPARLIFRKNTGAVIEILLLSPVSPSSILAVIMNSKESVTWKCMIRNFRKWNSGLILETRIPGKTELILRAGIRDREDNLITFTWNDKSLTFSEILEAIGKTPLPPYMKREVLPADSIRYQTVYSRNKGAVAAPTAGLHFTENIISELKHREHSMDFLTLHVSAGTFQPIKEKIIREHPMHSEQVLVREENIRNLLDNPGRVIAVGTTSMRTLESLYWFGVKLLKGENEDFNIQKLYPYQFPEEQLPKTDKSLKAVLTFMERNEIKVLSGDTEIFIFPGYSFRICNGLITNYHVPKSTLILLVAAFIGDDWRKVYKEALNNNYRFLSYGDSSLLLP